MPLRNILSFVILPVTGVTARVWFNLATHHTFEDALITFRYAENLADGLGFVYNTGEKVLGTTSPLWTFTLAVARMAGFSDTIANAKIVSIILDTLTFIILVTTFRSPQYPRFALIWAALFASSSGIVPIAVSGMETSLLLFSMALTIRGYTTKNVLFPIGIAMVVLTRIDGLLFAAIFFIAAWQKDARWAIKQSVIAFMVLLPWFLFSKLYFDVFFPVSMRAKMAAYEFDLSASAGPFLTRFTPFGEATSIERLVKIASLALLVIGLKTVGKQNHFLFPIALFFPLYCLVYSVSGGLIFSWYLTPAIFAHDIILTLGLVTLLNKVRESVGSRTVDMLVTLAVLGIICLNLSILHGRLDIYRGFQGLEDELRTEIGRWLRDNTEPGERVFLEPIGYIGYYAGTDVKIIDEVGIISPAIIALRGKGPGWYFEAVRTLRPDYIVEYTRSLEENIVEGTSSALFLNVQEQNWFYDRYHVIGTFEAKSHYPHIEEKEKRYTILKSRGK
jgi:hypothetical protein